MLPVGPEAREACRDWLRLVIFPSASATDAAAPSIPPWPLERCLRTQGDQIPPSSKRCENSSQNLGSCITGSDASNLKKLHNLGTSRRSCVVVPVLNGAPKPAWVSIHPTLFLIWRGLLRGLSRRCDAGNFLICRSNKHHVESRESK